MNDTLSEAQRLVEDKRPVDAAQLCFTVAQTVADEREARALINRGVELLDEVPPESMTKLLSWRHIPTRMFVTEWRKNFYTDDTLKRLSWGEFLLEKTLFVEKRFAWSGLSGSLDSLIRTYWWNADCYLIADKQPHCALRKARALKRILLLPAAQQQALCSEFEEEYKSVWRPLIPEQWRALSEQYLIDLRALNVVPSSTVKFEEADITAAMAFVCDNDFWQMADSLSTDNQKALAATAHQRLLNGEHKPQVQDALVERILRGAPLNPTHTHYMIANELPEGDVFAAARKQFLHQYHDLGGTAWEELLRQWQHSLSQAKLPSIQEYAITKEELRRVAQRYVLRNILSTMRPGLDWRKYHLTKVEELGMDADEVTNLITRTERLKRSDVERMFSELPDAYARIERSEELEARQEDFRKFNEWTAYLNQKLQSLWQVHGAKLGEVHFLLVVNLDHSLSLDKISTADLLKSKPGAESEAILREKLTFIIGELARDPIVRSNEGGSEIWVQVKA